MWVPDSLASPRDVTEKRDHCMNPLSHKRRLSTQNWGRRELSKATAPDRRGPHNKLTLETSHREISWAHTGRRKKKNKNAIKIETGVLHTRRGIQCTSTHPQPTSGCSTLCPPSLSSSPAQSGTKPFPQKRGIRIISRLAKSLHR